MSVWPVLNYENVVAIDLAKAELLISSGGYQKGMSSGEAGLEIASLGKVLQNFQPELYAQIETDKKNYVANVGIPGTNEFPNFLYLGPYINGISYVPGSRKINLSFAVMFHASVSAASGYEDIRNGVELFSTDMDYVLQYLWSKLQEDRTKKKPIQYKLYDVRRPETVEKYAVQALIAGGRHGGEL